MAKPLHIPAPSSSLARLLDGAAGVAATTPVSAPAHAAPPARRTDRASSRAPSSRLIKREVVLTQEADAAFQELVDALRSGTRVRLTASHAFRAIMRVLQTAAPAIREAAGTHGPLVLPSNAPGYEEQRVEFEARLADILRKSWPRES